MKFVVKKNKKKGKFYFEVLAANRAPMLKSPLYANKRNLTLAIGKLKAGLPEAKVVDEAA
jgi:uncharacterized protein YegP (UPF0339 family)